MTRQNYYKQRSLRKREGVEEALVLELIRRERGRQPRIGGRKLLWMIRGDLASAGVEMGRDRFFELLGRHDLLVARRRGVARTTDSGHGFGFYPNEAKGLKVSGPNQLVVSDITYIRTIEGFMYLSLVMDAFSRKIVGWDSSDSLEMEGSLRALSMAVSGLPAGSRLMHHSDRGSQYCCRAYVGKLRAKGIGISMTEENHCYENGKAERLNGIMKQEFGLGETFGSKGEVLSAVREAVCLYNQVRPHGALGYQVPAEVHGRGTGEAAA